MLRMWGVISKNNRYIKDITVSVDEEDTRTHKILKGLDSICEGLGLSVPIWLELNIKDFSRFKRTRFNKDNFIGSIDFDYLQIQIIEE